MPSWSSGAADFTGRRLRQGPGIGLSTTSLSSGRSASVLPHLRLGAGGSRGLSRTWQTSGGARGRARIAERPPFRHPATSQSLRGATGLSATVPAQRFSARVPSRSLGLAAPSWSTPMARTLAPGLPPGWQFVAQPSVLEPLPEPTLSAFDLGDDGAPALSAGELRAEVVAGLARLLCPADAPRGTACSVCLEPLASGCAKLPCGHFFHQDCALPWLALRGTCPMCRAGLGQVAAMAATS
mmetsp:Transcript_44642/g.123731  ORF Transcript_44642/g.123731 Transcript_44642/m.123731 type:complete len:240 (-) Transcript_44642:156-875(-)